MLAEYRWVRNSEADDNSNDVSNRNRIAAEVADVGIAYLLFCDRIGLDLNDAMEENITLSRRNYPVEQSRG